MCDIDWGKLYQATSKENRPTPGYLFNDIIQNVSYADPRHIPAVAEYLGDCVDGDHAHVKLKALFVIKSLAYRVPPFCECMRERLPSVQDAAAFSGPPSALFGDEPYRLVREAAEGALAALTGGEHYHEQYREMSQRIVGFGNFQPGEDTVLPDGSVNVGRDIGVKDIALGTVGLIQSGVGALLGSVKDMFSNPFGEKKGSLGALGTEEEDDDPDAGYDDGEDCPEPDEPQGTTDEDGCYHPSAGSYVPPTVPVPAPEPTTLDEPETVSDLFEVDDHSMQLEVRGTEPGAESAVLGAEEEASFMRVLGLRGCSQSLGTETDRPAKLEAEDLNPSEAEILDLLGLGKGSSDASRGGALCQQSKGPMAEDASQQTSPGPSEVGGVAVPMSASTDADACSSEAPEEPPSLMQMPRTQPVALANGFLEV